jgi:hypothetical protein
VKVGNEVAPWRFCIRPLPVAIKAIRSVFISKDKT